MFFISNRDVQLAVENGNFVPPFRFDRNEGYLEWGSIADKLEFPSMDLNCYNTHQPLVRLIAELNSVNEDQVLITAGAEDALARCIRVFIRSRGSAVTHTPTFPLIQDLLLSSGSQEIAVNWLTGDFPLSEFLNSITEKTDLVLLVTPNNPTGLVIPFEAICEILQRCADKLVVVDTVYLPFAEQNYLQRLLKFPNCVVVTSLSKSWGLAGLRVGCVLGAPQCIERLRKGGGRYTISNLSLRIAEQCLLFGESLHSRFVQQVKKERRLLSGVLRNFGYSPVASQGNFVFCEVENSLAFYEGLKQRNVLIKVFLEDPLRNFVRISCPGNELAFAQLMSAISEVLEF